MPLHSDKYFTTRPQAPAESDHALLSAASSTQSPPRRGRPAACRRSRPCRQASRAIRCAASAARSRTSMRRADGAAWRCREPGLEALGGTSSSLKPPYPSRTGSRFYARFAVPGGCRRVQTIGRFSPVVLIHECHGAHPQHDRSEPAAHRRTCGRNGRKMLHRPPTQPPWRTALTPHSPPAQFRRSAASAAEGISISISVSTRNTNRRVLISSLH